MAKYLVFSSPLEGIDTTYTSFDEAVIAAYIFATVYGEDSVKLTGRNATRDDGKYKVYSGMHLIGVTDDLTIAAQASSFVLKYRLGE